MAESLNHNCFELNPGLKQYHLNNSMSKFLTLKSLSYCSIWACDKKCSSSPGLFVYSYFFWSYFSHIKLWLLLFNIYQWEIKVKISSLGLKISDQNQGKLASENVTVTGCLITIQTENANLEAELFFKFFTPSLDKLTLIYPSKLHPKCTILLHKNQFKMQ